MNDVSHFLKVFALTKTIGELEGLATPMQETLELAADREIFADLPVALETVQRISWIVSYHHTYGLSDDLDYQILLEADYLVNTGESGHSAESVQSALQKIFKTKTGSEFLSSLYLK